MQHLERALAALVVEIHERVVENDGTGLVLRQRELADREAHRKIELVDRARAEKRCVPRDGVANLPGRGPQFLVELHAVVASAGELGENFRRPL